jgi:hypothetical protein
LGKKFLEKTDIGELVFGKNLGKLAHLRNLSPKIIYASKMIIHPKSLEKTQSELGTRMKRHKMFYW